MSVRTPPPGTSAIHVSTSNKQHHANKKCGFFLHSLNGFPPPRQWPPPESLRHESLISLAHNNLVNIIVAGGSGDVLSGNSLRRPFKYIHVGGNLYHVCGGG